MYARRYLAVLYCSKTRCARYSHADRHVTYQHSDPPVCNKSGYPLHRIHDIRDTVYLYGVGVAIINKTRTTTLLIYQEGIATKRRQPK